MENNYIICNGELCRVDELKHYGVPGMKWGVRKAQARSTYKSKVNEAFSRYEKAIADIEKPYKRGQSLSKKDYDRELKVEEQYQKEVSRAKAAYKAEKQAIRAEKKAVKAEAKAEKQTQSAKKTVSDMSDAELRAYINRVQMERQYSQLNKRQQSEGEKFVKGVLNESAKNVATKYVTKYATKAIDNIIERAAKK